LGINNADVALYLNNLSMLLKDIGRLDEAEQLMRRALAINERIYGPDHPNIGLGLNNLGSLMQANNNFEEAEHFFQRALQITERTLGLNHITSRLISAILPPHYIKPSRQKRPNR